jgi:hypothetical protein
MSIADEISALAIVGEVTAITAACIVRDEAARIAEAGEAKLQAELTDLRAKLARAREGLSLIAAGAPFEKPERYDGDNHGDSVSYGYQAQHFCDAEIAHAFLKETE